MRRLNMAVCLLALMMPVVAQGGGIAVFDNAAVWPYNDTGLTDDLDYLGVSYTKYTPANVADLFVSPNPADPQPIYDYDLVMLASGVWSSTSDPNYTLFADHRAVVASAVHDHGVGLVSFDPSLMAGYNYVCLPEDLYLITSGPLYYIDTVHSYLNNDQSGIAFPGLVGSPNDLTGYTGGPTFDVYILDDMVGAFYSSDPYDPLGIGGYPNGYLNGYETVIRGDYGSGSVKVTVAKEYGDGRVILSLAEFDYLGGTSGYAPYADREYIENMIAWAKRESAAPPIPEPGGVGLVGLGLVGLVRRKRRS